jgi:hypothetical protein
MAPLSRSQAISKSRSALKLRWANQRLKESRRKPRQRWHIAGDPWVFGAIPGCVHGGGARRTLRAAREPGSDGWRRRCPTSGPPPKKCPLAVFRYTRVLSLLTELLSVLPASSDGRGLPAWRLFSDGAHGQHVFRLGVSLTLHDAGHQPRLEGRASGKSQTTRVQEFGGLKEFIDIVNSLTEFALLEAVSWLLIFIFFDRTVRSPLTCLLFSLCIDRTVRSIIGWSHASKFPQLANSRPEYSQSASR